MPRAERRSYSSGTAVPSPRLVPLERPRPLAEALCGEIELVDDFDELPAELAAHFR
jgi:hypothetical protein